MLEITFVNPLVIFRHFYHVAIFCSYRSLELRFLVLFVNAFNPGNK